MVLFYTVIYIIIDKKISRSRCLWKLLELVVLNYIYEPVSTQYTFIKALRTTTVII